MKKFFATSDVHGFYSLLMKYLKEAGWEEDNPNHILIICGDFLDRGYEPGEMVEFLLELLRQDRVILVRGNHEDLYLDCRQEVAHKICSAHHKHNGTYDSVIKLKKHNLDEAFVNIIENHCVDYFELGNYVFVHGWIPAKVLDDFPIFFARHRYYEFDKDWREADQKEWEAARWTNGMEAASQGIIEEGKTIVCGHWHTGWGHHYWHRKGENEYENLDVFREEGIIALDACTAYSNKINVLVFDGNGNEITNKNK